MSKFYSCYELLFLSALSEKIPESLTEIQWIVLEIRCIYGDSIETIGQHLRAASARVRHIQSKAFDELIKVFEQEIECFSIKLVKQLSDAGSALTIKECLTEFPEIGEVEFNIMFALCQKNREGLFHRENELILLKDI